MASDVSHDGFNRNAKVSLSPSAREMAIAFTGKVGEMKPKHDFVLVFDWADSRRVRYPRNSNNWHELGAGIDLGVYERDQVPLAAVIVADGLEFAIKIDERILAQSRQRLIDVDHAASPPQLILR